MYEWSQINGLKPIKIKQNINLHISRKFVDSLIWNNTKGFIINKTKVTKKVYLLSSIREKCINISFASSFLKQMIKISNINPLLLINQRLALYILRHQIFHWRLTKQNTGNNLQIILYTDPTNFVINEFYVTYN